MEKTGPSDLYRSITEPEGWRERDKARDAAFIDAIPRLGGDPQEPGGDGGDYLLPMPPIGHPLRTLGVKLANLLDEDQWAECERMLSEGWDQDRVDRKTGADWRQNSSLDVWFPMTSEALNAARAAELRAAQEADELRAALRELVALADMKARLENLRAMGHGTDWDGYHKRHPAAWAAARRLALGPNVS